jgi:putative nucleotidyltransferase with HDIG domain
MNAEQLISKVPNLPAPAPSVGRLLELLAKPDADNDDMIRVIRNDGVMSAKLIGLCNSAAYGLSSPVNSIEQAVLLLGHAEIHRLVMSVGFSGSLSPQMRGYAMAEGELWRHSLLTAYVAMAVTALSRKTEVDPSIAFTAGLVHDIGKIVITHTLDDKTQAAMRELIEKNEHSLVEAERSILGTDHADVGACLLKQWGLPELLVESVANHHQPVIKPKPALSAIVHVADVISLEAGTSPGWASFAMRADESAMEALGLGREDIERLIISGYDAAEQVEEMIATT